MARILWHPRQENRFVVGTGSRITLYEFAPERSEIRQVTAQTDLQLMKCFAWSPLQTNDLFAVGLSTGKVDLIRLGVKDASRTNALSSTKPIISLPQRNSRACNALTFCPGDPKSLAVGLDKVRGDCSLVIWDISSATPATTIHATSPASEALSPPIFARSQSGPRIPRIDLGARADPRILQQHCPAEIVSAISFLPESSNLLLAGLSHRWLRLFDLRSPSSPTNVASKVHGVCTDPLDANRVGCFGDGTVTIWDMRQFVQPLLSFSEKDAHADGAKARSASIYSSIEFSSTRRGQLATLEKDAAYVRFWDLRQSKAISRDNEVTVPKKREPSSAGTNEPHSLSSKKSWANLPWMPSYAGSNASSRQHEVDLGSLVLCDTRRTQSFTPSLASFAHVPPSRSDPHPLKCEIMVVNHAGDLKLHSMYDTPKQLAWSSQGDFLVGGGRAMRQRPGVRDEFGDDPESDISHSRHNEPLLPFVPHRASEGVTKLTKNSRTAPRSDRYVRSPSTRSVGRLLQDDILMIMRSRCLAGYSIGQDNRRILREESDRGQSDRDTLPDVWEWITRAQEFLCKHQRYDFSYQGVAGLWEGFGPAENSQPLHEHSPLPSEVLPETRKGKRHSRGPRSAAEEEQHNYQMALQSLLHRKEGHKHSWKPAVSSSRVPQRQAALHLLEWSLKEDELMYLTKKWEKRGQVSRAVCWLVFIKQYREAIEALMRSKDEALNLLSGTLTALIPGSGHSSRNPELRAHCERLSIRLQDPYIRIMLTYLSHGDWSEVIQEETIPFRERLAIALQFFDDKTLTSYLHRCTQNALHHGYVDGLLVTGLTPTGMSILQSYVDHTGDVQTAAIISSLVCPRKFTDTRAGRWLDTYRDLLDGFKLFGTRVNFDIQRGQLIHAAIEEGDLEAEEHVPPPQILIKCNYCSKTVSQAEVPASKPTACPHCTRDLPRCAICLLTLGIVRDPIKEASAGLQSFRETIDDAIIICQTCRHGGHASHILQWFLAEDGTPVRETCPVASCSCKCANEF